MQLPLYQLEKHLQKPLQGCYLLFGDEPLLRQEACDAIAAQALRTGFSERRRLSVDADLNWSAVLDDLLQPSLFADTRVVICDLPSNKLDDATRAALIALAENPDTLLIALGPRLDKRQQNAKWFKQLSANGVFVPIWPPRLDELPRWFEQRLKRHQLGASTEALALLAEQYEGNLLAASQAVEQLSLLYQRQTLQSEHLAPVILDQARLGSFQWLDALLGGDTRRALRALAAQEQEGTEALLPLGLLNRELLKLHQIACSPGMPSGAALEKMQIWKARQSLVRQAVTRLGRPGIEQAQRDCAQLELSIKTSQVNMPYLALQQLTINLSQSRPHQALWV